MSRHDPITTLGQILDYAAEAVEMAKNYNRSGLDTKMKHTLSANFSFSLPAAPLF